MVKIPLFDTTRQWHKRQGEILSTIQRVFDKGQLILGPEEQAFEKEFAALVGQDALHFGIGVGSATDALILGLKALGVGPGDEVITTPLTAVPTVSALRGCGARPVFVDVHPNSPLCDLNPRRLQTLVQSRPRIKGIVAVHLHGEPLNLEELCHFAREHRLFVLEDCAQSFGAKFFKPTGALGDISCFSFYPTKNLGAAGDGGMCVTARPELAEKLRSMRMYGFKYDCETGAYPHHVALVDGINSRLDELQAALLRLKLQHFDEDFSLRQERAWRYLNAIENPAIQLPHLPAAGTHAFHIFAIRTKKRDALKAYLAERGVATGVHYATPLHLMPAFKDLGYMLHDFPNAEAACNEMLSLPVFPELTLDEQDHIIRSLNQWSSS